MLSWHSTHLWRRGAAHDVSAWPSGHVRRRCAPPVRRFAAAARSSGLRVSRVTPRCRCFLRELGLLEGRRFGERGLPLAPPDSRAAASRCDVGVRTRGLVRLGDRGEGVEVSERCARAGAGSSQAARSIRPAPLGLVLELRHMLARGSSALPPRAAPSAILARSAATPASPRSRHARCSVSSLMLLSAIHHQVAVS